MGEKKKGDNLSSDSKKGCIDLKIRLEKHIFVYDLKKEGENYEGNR